MDNTRSVGAVDMNYRGFSFNQCDIFYGYTGQMFAFGFSAPEKAFLIHVGPFAVGICWGIKPAA